MAGKIREALPHDTPLISILVAGFGLAFVFGLLAQRLKLPLIAGYLVAGVVIGVRSIPDVQRYLKMRQM